LYNEFYSSLQRSESDVSEYMSDSL